MKELHAHKGRKRPVPYKEFDRFMLAIGDQTRDYPHEALEDSFLHLESRGDTDWETEVGRQLSRN
jgi:formylglycine-generating enzyme required for sulfatase activity